MAFNAGPIKFLPADFDIMLRRRRPAVRPGPGGGIAALACRHIFSGRAGRRLSAAGEHGRRRLSVTA